MLNEKVDNILKELELTNEATQKMKQTVIEDVLTFELDENAEMKAKLIGNNVLVRFGPRDFSFDCDGELQGAGMFV